MIKRIVEGAIIALSLFCLIAIGMRLAVSFTPNRYYENQAVIVELERESDTVVVEDTTGNLWAFYGCDNAKCGQSVIMLMDDCGTSNDVTDDYIIKVMMGE